MPTVASARRFGDDYRRLTHEEQDAFRAAVDEVVRDLASDHDFRAGLRVKGVQGSPGIYEMRWAGDGRATFEYGAPIRAGMAHVIRRRVGGHDILSKP